jgi:hypothetical protein
VEDVPVQSLIPESHAPPSAIENTQFVELKPNHINLGVVTETDEDVVYISNNEQLETIECNNDCSNNDNDNNGDNNTRMPPDQSIHEPGLEYYSVFYVKLDE